MRTESPRRHPLAWLLPMRSDALPPRVREAIARREALSEVLIGWVQLVLVATFGGLYALAPPAEGSDAGIMRPVPVALVIYLSFTVARLVLAYRQRLPSWVVYLSIIVDMALLFLLIWTFHRQYAQPASFYLKAPTMMYVFIFIAIRALRFDPRFVLFAGFTAVCGWAILLLYALFVGGDDVMITRNYVDYLTHHAVLLGAEFDKMISMVMVTLVLGLALSRARSFLIGSVTEGIAAGDLRRFFDPDVARAITGSDTAIRPGKGDIRDVAVLMVDIRGFSRFAATADPNEVIALLESYYTVIGDAVTAQGGSVDHYSGDGVMATFGAVRPGPTYAAQALTALIRTIEAGRTWNRQRRQRGEEILPVNAALASGPVIFGAFGSGNRLGFTVIGDAANRAAKLEKHNRVLGTMALAPAETVALARAQQFEADVSFERFPGQTVEGIPGPVTLLGITAPDS